MIIVTQLKVFCKAYIYVPMCGVSFCTCCTHSTVLTGVGPAKGLSLIRQYGTIEKIIANNPKVFTSVCSYFVKLSMYIPAAKFP